VEQFFGPDLVLQTLIHKNVDIPQAAAIQKGVVEYSSITPGADDSKLGSMSFQVVAWPAQVSVSKSKRSPSGQYN
jgi:hypothetical protein